MTSSSLSRSLGSILFAAAAAVASIALAAEPAWERVRETSDGIAVYFREIPGSTVREAKAICAIPAPPEIVIAAAADPATFTDSTKYVSASSFQRTADPNVWYLYQELSYPVVAPRDYALRYEMRLDPAQKRYRLSWAITTAYGPPPRDGVIRVGRADGYIDVEPIPSGRGVIATYHLVADPGGNIPSWVMRIAQKFNLPAIMRELRDVSVRRARAR